MNDNEGTRNFEPVQTEEQDSPKAQKPDPKKKIAIAIFSIVIAIVVLFCAVIVTKIVYELNDGSDNTDDDSPANISYTTVSKASSDVNKGILLEITEADDMKDAPGLVSIVPDEDGNPYYMGITSLPKDKMISDAGAALKKMAEDLYTAKSVRFVVAYAYHATPSYAYDAEHVLGTVVDLKQVTDETAITYAKFDSATLKWLNQNCAKYGFINSFPDDTDEEFVHDNGASERSIQFRYVGVAHATYIMDNNLTFDEYLEKIKDYTPDKPLSITGADENKYSVYYVESKGDMTEVKVPDNYAYEISGNNKNGFIITVNRSEKE